MPRRPHLILAIALVVYVAYRALVLYTNFDAVCMPNYELYFGNIGKVLLDGWYGPPLSQYYDNCGGHLVLGLASAPMFALFGPSYLALKLVPLVLGFLALIVIWAIARREFGTRAAGLAVLFFAIGPPTLAKYSMLAKGNHFENLLFQLLALWAFYRLHRFAVGTPARARGLLIFGVCAGFAVFFYFGSLVLLAVLAVMHLLIRGPRGALADLRYLLPAGLLGLSPLIWIQLSGGARPSTFLGSHFGGTGGAQVQHIDRIARLKQLFGDFLPRGTCFEDLGPVPGELANWTYLAVFVISWLALMPRLVRGVKRSLKSFRQGESGSAAEREMRRFQDLKTLPLLGYLPAFILLYSVSRFEFDAYSPPVEVGQFRYLVPHYMFACFVVAIAAAQFIASSKRLARAGWAMAALMLVTQLFSLPVIDLSFERTDLANRYPGYDFRYEKSVLLRDSLVDPQSGARTWDLELLAAQLAEFPRREKQESAFGLGHWMAWAQTMPPAKKASEPRQPHLSLAELCAPFSEEVGIDLARGAGAFLRSTNKEQLARLLAQLIQEDHPLLPFVIEGLCLRSDFPLALRTRAQLRANRALGSLIPANLHYAWRRGQGVVLGRLLTRGIASDVALVQEQLTTEQAAADSELWYGVGFGAAESLGELEAPPTWLVQVAGAGRAATLRGLGAGLRQRLGLEAAAPVFKAWKPSLTPEDRGALEQGLRTQNWK